MFFFLLMATGLCRPHLGGALFDPTLTAQHKQPSFSKAHFERAALLHGGSNTPSEPTAFQSITQEFLAGAVSRPFPRAVMATEEMASPACLAASWIFDI